MRNLNQYSNATVSGEAAVHPSKEILQHNCIKNPCIKPRNILSTYKFVVHAIINFRGIFLDKYKNEIFYSWLGKDSETEKALIQIQIRVLEYELKNADLKNKDFQVNYLGNNAIENLNLDIVFYLWDLIKKERQKLTNIDIKNK